MSVLSGLFFVVLFFLGAAMGSFAGVIIERSKEGFDLRERWSIFGGRSTCPSCGATLRWWQLIPLVGWFVQGGKCNRCDASIPRWYLRIELMIGTVFVATFLVVVGVDPRVLVEQLATGNRLVLVHLLFWWGVNRAFVAIIIADLYREVLNSYIWLLLLLIVGILLPIGWPMLIEQALIGAFIFGVVFGGLYRFGRWRVSIRYGETGEGIGLGDLLLAVLIGALSVFWPFATTVAFIQLICWYLIVSSLLGIAYWGMRVLMTGSTSERLPFLPALIIAYYLLLLRGGNLVDLVSRTVI